MMRDLDSLQQLIQSLVLLALQLVQQTEIIPGGNNELKQILGLTLVHFGVEILLHPVLPDVECLFHLAQLGDGLEVVVALQEASDDCVANPRAQFADQPPFFARIIFHYVSYFFKF